MARQLISDKKEKSLGENVVVIAVFALLMSTFIYHFFKQQDSLAKVGFDAIANAFIIKLTLVHAQWLMDGKPAFIEVSSRDLNINDDDASAIISNRVPVNKKGWIDVEDGNGIRCEKIWQYVMDTEMEFMRSPVSAVEIKLSQKQTTLRGNSMCRFSIPSGEFFEYFPHNGKIKVY
ncbi:MAG: hypothetical protein HRT38_00575 [Alteromonadaceae bacterium]|nr:hypothetical protein [Alteromonadaceae bacterium]